VLKGFKKLFRELGSDPVIWLINYLYTRLHNCQEKLFCTMFRAAAIVYRCNCLCNYFL